ncbi:MAG: pyridoxamine 5'-phosphate oxidase family protein [Parvibaculaceae bacterium]
MDRDVSDTAFTDAVKRMQERQGSRDFYRRFEMEPRGTTRITGELAQFIAAREHFYFATASAKGAPYIQHRGGPKGFLKVLGEKELGFADFGGNQQYISLGNLSENPAAFIFLIDYVNRRRIKIWGEARAVETDPALTRKLAETADGSRYRARLERAILFTVTAWDVNCSAHILPRYTPDLLEPAFDRLENRIKQLEAQVRELGGDPGPFDHAG